MCSSFFDQQSSDIPQLYKPIDDAYILSELSSMGLSISGTRGILLRRLAKAIEDDYWPRAVALLVHEDTCTNVVKAINLIVKHIPKFERELEKYKSRHTREISSKHVVVITKILNILRNYVIVCNDDYGLPIDTITTKKSLEKTTCLTLSDKFDRLLDLPDNVIVNILLLIPKAHHLYLFSHSCSYIASLCRLHGVRSKNYNRFCTYVQYTDSKFDHKYTQLVSGDIDGKEIWENANTGKQVRSVEWSCGKKHGKEIIYRQYSYDIPDIGECVQVTSLIPLNRDMLFEDFRGIIKIHISDDKKKAFLVFGQFFTGGIPVEASKKYEITNIHHTIGIFHCIDDYIEEEYVWDRDMIISHYKYAIPLLADYAPLQLYYSEELVDRYNGIYQVEEWALEELEYDEDCCDYIIKLVKPPTLDGKYTHQRGYKIGIEHSYVYSFDDINRAIVEEIIVENWVNGKKNGTETRTTRFEKNKKVCYKSITNWLMGLKHGQLNLYEHGRIEYCEVWDNGHKVESTSSGNTEKLIYNKDDPPLQVGKQYDYEGVVPNVRNYRHAY